MGKRAVSKEDLLPSGNVSAYCLCCPVVRSRRGLEAPRAEFYFAGEFLNPPDEDNLPRECFKVPRKQKKPPLAMKMECREVMGNFLGDIFFCKKFYFVALCAFSEA